MDRRTLVSLGLSLPVALLSGRVLAVPQEPVMGGPEKRGQA